MEFQDFPLSQVGLTVQLVGAVFQDKDRDYVVLLPNDMPSKDVEFIGPDSAQWQEILRQSDIQETIMNTPEGKAIVRKSQRSVDQNVSWNVYRRDNFRCRYCYQERPLTVDHIDLWEDCGATTEENLLSACKQCNKTRGNMSYEDWLQSKEYITRSQALPQFVRQANDNIVTQLPYLRSLRVTKQRNR